MNIYMKYFSMHIKSRMQYKESLIMENIGYLMTFISFYVSILFLFNKFSNVKGFTVYEVLLCTTTVNLGFSIANIFAGGFDIFAKNIKTGNFDIMLIRPQNLFVQIMGSEIKTSQFFATIQCSLILIYALTKLNLQWTLYKFIVILSMIAGSAIIFTSVFILGAALTFVTIEGLEIINILSHGGREMAQYPMGIYRKELLNFFTFVVPLSCVNYYPLLYILGKSNNWAYGLMPLASVLFLCIAVKLWYLGLKKYSSTGS